MKEEQVPVPMLDLPPMPEKPSVPEKPSRFCLLQNICNRKFLQDDRWAERFKKFSDFKRMIYWADQPDGGIGVSFVDPVEFYKLGDSWNDAGFLDRSMQKGILDEIFSGATVLTISSESTSELEQELFAKSRHVFQDYRWHWCPAYQSNGNRIDDVLIGWSLPKPSPSVWDEEPIYSDSDYSDFNRYPYDVFDSENEPCRSMILNDFSNIPFNYKFLHSIVSNNLLLRKIEKYKFFTDGQLVNTQLGYYSPAYALALLQSFQKRNLVTVALKSFRSFVHHHPIDPITTLCDRIARKTFQGVTYGSCIKMGRDMKHDYSMPDVFIDFDNYEKDYDEEDYYEEDYVDDPDPYYQEMEYWNTH